HLRPAVRRPGADLRRRAPAAQAADPGGSGRRRGSVPGGPAGAEPADGDRLGLPMVDLSQHEGPPRARLRAAPARGDARGRRPLAARATRQPAPAPQPRPLRPAGDRSRAAGAQRMITLYRCPTRTNVLCPCGAVERRLRKLGLEHGTERVPYKRSARPEIEELTSQRRVPVLVDGDEVISDSKRIRQYLDFRYGKKT